MDCNRDEAAKAKELAEKKFEEKDITGARKLALKAHNLFPSLDGLQPLLATLNVYVSAGRKINGEVDWYGVLGIDPSSDDETVRKQYRKLALTLHPDKNKSVGAEGAFKILSEAWSLLSDKARRIAYDQKRSSRGIYQKVMPNNPSKTVGRNGLQASASNGNFSQRSNNAPNPHLNSGPPPWLQRNTFWTVCTSCNMQFEYLLCYLDKKLECYNCKEPFVATEIAPPHMPLQTAAYTSSAEGKTLTFNAASGRAGHAGGAANIPGSTSSNAQTMNGIQLPHETLKKRHEDAQVSATLEAVMKSRTNAYKRGNVGDANGPCSTMKGEKPRKRRRATEQKMNDGGIKKPDRMVRGSEAVGHENINGVQRGIAESKKKSFEGTKWPAGTRELSLLENRNMLMTKAKIEICKKLNEWKNMAAASKASNKFAGPRENEKTKEKIPTFKNLTNGDGNGLQYVGSKRDEGAKANYSEEKLKTSSPETQASDSAASLSMTVPDPDFHDFDKDRSENSFGDNQVWAAYDDDDGMPRYYAMIHNVISRKPFKMRISWLNSKSNAEFGPINWVGSGFYKTSGDFRVGKHEINKSVNSFSHRVKWTKGARGAIRIYPRKGDVWALYKNWSPEWNELTPDEVIHQYDMVQVLDEYTEEKGVTVIPLTKIVGFKTVFRQHMDHEQARVIPKEEMFRFSHQVPSCLLTGQESPNAPKGCWELDPAATPMDLLQVTSEAREQMRKKETTEKGARVDDVSHAKRTDFQQAVLSSGSAKNEAMKIKDGIKV